MEPDSRERAAYAAVPLSKFWEEKTVAEVDKDSCAKYGQWRRRSDGTVRRELGILRAAIYYAADTRRLKERVKVFLPEAAGPSATLAGATRGSGAVARCASIAKEPILSAIVHRHRVAHRPAQACNPRMALVADILQRSENRLARSDAPSEQQQGASARSPASRAGSTFEAGVRASWHERLRHP